MLPNLDSHLRLGKEAIVFPIIGAALHRIVPARKNQVWAVLRPDDSKQRLCYSLAATFLGRMCISGYSKLKTVLEKSRRAPKGWQYLIRRSADGENLLVVIHSFELSDGERSVDIDLPADSQWIIDRSFNSPDGTRIANGKIAISKLGSFTGIGLKIKRLSSLPRI